MLCGIFQLLRPLILGKVKFYIGIHRRRDTMTMFHAESSKGWGTWGILTETDSGYTVLAVDHDAEQLACLVKGQGCIFLW